MLDCPRCSLTAGPTQGPYPAVLHRPKTKTTVQDLFNILPLSLVRRLVSGLDHPYPGAEFNELDPPKWLGEQIGQLIRGVDVACLDAPFLQAGPDEMVPQPDVLASFMEHGVLRQGQSRLVVHHELH